MIETIDKNKRIAKNTILLYFRMIFLLFINLYTSRIVIQTLGVEDYGVYNVVGGLVATFTIISGSLTSAISRYLTIELGKKDNKNLQITFASSLTVQLIISAILLVFAELVFVFFLNYKMNISSERLIPANWVLQFSIFTFLINLISIPYNAAIIAHERMKAFAYISLYEASAKLLIAYMLLCYHGDKLILYGACLCLLAVSVRYIYGRYCSKNFEECKFKLDIDKNKVKSMLSFSGWNFLGASSNVLQTNGIDLLINIFFGPTINATRGVTSQVFNAVNGFATNFMTAINPQIIKSYAQGNYQYLYSLICRGALMSYCLLLVLSLPIIMNATCILELWLKTPPPFAAEFVRLVLVCALIESLSSSLITSAMAYGKIKKYQITISSIQLLNFVFAYLLFKNDCEPYCTYYISIFIAFVCLIVRLMFIKKMTNMPVSLFVNRVIIRVVLITILVMFPILLFHSLVEKNTLQILVFSIMCCIWTLLVEYLIGLSSSEKIYLKKYIKSKFQMVNL